MIAKLHVSTAPRGGATFLKNTYFTTPLKIADVTEEKNRQPLHLMLVSASPGILDGDLYELCFELESGSAVELHTQSYQRLFNMKQQATQTMKVTLATNSSFCYLPHPSVPHTNAAFTSKNHLYLQANCSLIIGEIITCGRKLNDELFRFTSYHSITEIYLEEKLVVKENLLLKPASMNMEAIGQLEGFTHQASLVYLHPEADIKSCQENILQLLETEPDFIFGVSAAPVNGLVVRILGQKAEQLHGCLKKIATILPQYEALKTRDYAI